MVVSTQGVSGSHRAGASFHVLKWQTQETTGGSGNKKGKKSRSGIQIFSGGKLMKKKNSLYYNKRNLRNVNFIPQSSTLDFTV